MFCVEAVCESHIKFKRIHSSVEGNGRTGRLLMIYLLLKSGIHPLIINKADKFKYITFQAGEGGKGFAEYAKQEIECCKG
ncbi:Fic family protein [Bacillus sp. N9]